MTKAEVVFAQLNVGFTPTLRPVASHVTMRGNWVSQLMTGTAITTLPIKRQRFTYYFQMTR